MDCDAAIAGAGGACLTEELWPGMHFSTCAHVLHSLHLRINRDMKLRENGLEVIPRSFELFPLHDGTFWAPEEHASPRTRH